MHSLIAIYVAKFLLKYTVNELYIITYYHTLFIISWIYHSMKNLLEHTTLVVVTGLCWYNKPLHVVTILRILGL